MPRFSFRAVNEAGIARRGQRSAANENELFFQLRAQGLSLVDCRADENKFSLSTDREIPLPEQALFFRHMLALTQAGVPAHITLQDIAPSLPARMQEVAHFLQEEILAGTALSTAFQKSRQRFDALAPLLLQGGEKTGKLNEALRFLEETLRWKYDMAQGLKRQMMAPMVQLVLASIAVSVLMTVAVPQIVQFLGMMGEGIPLYANILLTTMKVLGFTLVVAACAALCAFLFYPLIRSFGGNAALFCDRLLFQIPFFGRLLLKLALARMTHIFAALLGSGIGVMEALTILPQTEPNKALAAQYQEIKAGVNLGQPLSAAFTTYPLVPPYVVRLLKVGEDGGKLPETLQFISSIYQREAREELEHLIKIITLFITAGVGLSLILVVGGAIVPLYNGLSHFAG